MTRKYLSRISVLMLATILCVSPLSGCKKAKTYDNETYPLILSINEPEGVFSPFFSSAAYDSEIAGRTQLGMLSVDENGKPAFGDDEAVVAKDISMSFYDKDGNKASTGTDDGTTVYQFVLKKDLVFSDNTPLTIKDVLFNYYVFLDPVYTGSATMYSTNIKGLAQYRTQNPLANDGASASYDDKFYVKAATRIDILKRYLNGENFSEAITTVAKADLATASEEFKKELESDWLNSVGTVEDMRKQKYPVTSDWQCFFLNVGVIGLQVNTAGLPKTTSDGMYVLDMRGIEEVFRDDYNNNFSKENCLKVAFEKYMPSGNPRPSAFVSILSSWNTGISVLPSIIAAQEKTAEIEELKKSTNGLPVKNIEGIKALKGNLFTASDISKSKVAYDSSYEMVQITINGVDPKAIWNFAVSVAPMHYYSDAERTQKAVNDTAFEQHFGVEYGDYEFFRDVIQAKNRIPMGAGPYKMSTASGSANKTLDNFKNEFWAQTHGMVYFERNDKFLMGSPKIKYLRYKVVDSSNIMNALTEQNIHFSDPQAKEDNINIVNNSSYLQHTTVLTNGYGYIGISAKHVPEIALRRALMTALDTSYIKQYYPGHLSSLIYRPMSLVSWVYEDIDDLGVKSQWSPTSKYFIENVNARKAQVEAYLIEAGYRKDASSGYWAKEGKVLTLAFQVAGNSEDHPAWMVFEKAAEFLNGMGCNITVRSNSRVLSLLSSGEGLAVWAAAWGGGVDPDMYQLYHKDSKAASVNNWGYDWMWTQNQGSTEEKNIIKALSEKIDAGRETLIEEERKTIYRDALELVMDLAVELPLYQRNDMYVYNTNIIDVSTLIPKDDCTAFRGPLDEIWNVSLKTR